MNPSKSSARKSAQVLGRRDSADNPIGAVGERRFVDDGIIDFGFDATVPAPILGKDVVNVDVFTEEDSVIEFLS